MKAKDPLPEKIREWLETTPPQPTLLDKLRKPFHKTQEIPPQTDPWYIGPIIADEFSKTAGCEYSRDQLILSVKKPNELSFICGCTIEWKPHYFSGSILYHPEGSYLTLKDLRSGGHDPQLDLYGAIINSMKRANILTLIMKKELDLRTYEQSEEVLKKSGLNIIEE